MKKFILDLTVTENLRLHTNYVLLKLTSQTVLPEMLPGQFAQFPVSLQDEYEFTINNT